MEYLKWFSGTGKDSEGFELMRKFGIPFMVPNIESPSAMPIFLEYVEYKHWGKKVSHLHWRLGCFETDDLFKSYPDYDWDNLELISWEEYDILFQSADPVSLRKLRRKIEDHLRKNPKSVLKIAKILNI